jgi:hypothetical protein
MDTNGLSPQEQVELIVRSPKFQDYLMAKAHEQLVRQFSIRQFPQVPPQGSQVSDKPATDLPIGSLADHAYSKR